MDSRQGTIILRPPRVGGLSPTPPSLIFSGVAINCDRLRQGTGPPRGPHGGRGSCRETGPREDRTPGRIPPPWPPGRPLGGSCSLSKSVTINGDATKYLFHTPKDLGPRPPSRPRHPFRPSYPPFPYLSPEGPRTEGRGGSSVPGGPQNRGGGSGGQDPTRGGLNIIVPCRLSKSVTMTTPLNSRQRR